MPTTFIKTLLVAGLASTVALTAPAQVNLDPIAAAVVRDGANAGVDLNEETLGYLMVKYGNGSSGKAYYKFDFTGQTPNTNGALSLTFTTHNASQRQHAQLSALNQPYPSFTNSSLIWTNAQANDITSNALLTDPTNTFTATPLVDFISPGGAGATYTVAIPPPWGQFLFNNQLVLVMTSPFNDPTNQANGLRLRTNATYLTFTALSGAAPTISAITNLTLVATKTSDTINFTVGDTDSGADSLNVSATSSDERVLPSGNIYFGGTGANRNFYLVAGDTPGTATVYVNVADPTGNTSQTTFTVTVLPLNYNPTIASTNAQAFTWINTPVTLNLTVDDVETAADNLQITGEIATYSAAILTNVTFGGTGSNRTVTVTPSHQDGLGVVNVAVTDGNGNSNALNLAVMVLPATNVIFSDHFDYPDGQLFPSSANFWSRRNSQAQSLRFNTSGQQAFIRPKASTDDAAAPLAGAPYAPGSGAVLYTTFMATWVELPDVIPAVTNSAGSFQQLLNNGTATSAALAEVATTTNGVPEPNFRLGLIDYLGNLNAYTSKDLPVPSGAAMTSAKIITRYDVDSGASSLWIDATTEAAPSVASVDSTNPPSISYVGLRQDLGMGYIYIDDLKVTLVRKPVVTAMQTAAGNNLEITFTAGPADQASSFAMEFAPQLGAAFAAVNANIATTGAGTFKATVAAPGNQGFYRLKRMPMQF